MLVAGTAPGKDGAEYPLPQLDAFTNCTHGFTIGPDQVVRESSEGSAYETYIDRYLEIFSRPFAEVCKLVTSDEALNLILTRRNISKHRDRVMAAEEIALLVPNHLKVQQALAEDDIYLDWDSRQAEQAWVWQGVEFTGVLVEVQAGRMYLGEGDGYHRGSDYEIFKEGAKEGEVVETMDDPPRKHQLRSYDVNKAASIRKAVRAAIKFSLEQQEEWTEPCDEHYWRDYSRIKEMLEGRQKAKK